MKETKNCFELTIIFVRIENLKEGVEGIDRIVNLKEGVEGIDNSDLEGSYKGKWDI